MLNSNEQLDSMFFLRQIAENSTLFSPYFLLNPTVGFIAACFIMLCGGAMAEVIDIFPTSTGWQLQRANGEILGNMSSREAAQRAADVYTRRGNTVNWRTSSVTTTTGGVSGSTSATTGGASNVPPSRQVTGGGTAPRQITGGSNVPATTTGGSNVPATTGGGSGGGNTGGTASAASRVNVGGAALGIIGMVSGAAGLYESTAGTDKATWTDVGTGALSGAGFAAGAAAFVNAIPVGGQIAYGGAVLIGTAVGALGAGAEMFSETDCEMDPVLGIYACCNISKLSNIDAYRAEIGDRMFTDTFPYVRYCVQGKKEFKEEQPWLKGRFLDDHWSDTVEVGLCPGYSMPADGLNQEETKIQLYAANDASVGYCWAWECADPGRVRSGGACIGSDVTDASMMGPFLPENFEVNSNHDSGGNTAANAIGTNCNAADLPQYATTGTYIDNGVAVVCVATACQSGTYLVVNSSGVSQGWCVASTYCNNKPNTHLNIIDETKTDLQCVSNMVSTVSDDAEFGGELDAAVIVACSNAALDRLNATAAVYNQTVDDCVPTSCKNGYRLDGEGESAKCVANTDNECERGVTGYVMFEGVCMPIAQMQQIQSQRAEQQVAQQAAQELQNLRSRIDGYAKTILDIEIAHADDKVAVWKNADGKFNTSRLLSDSIAGIALGTVGGLVVNKVVKDKHVETGFEEIGCAIDDERIADFDDVFVINGAVDKNECVGNNTGYGNIYVWASRNSDGSDYTRMVEDVSNPDNNACWVRVDIESDNPNIRVSDVPSRWFIVGQQITCGDWTDRNTLRQRALDARKSGRTWATVGGAVGGAGVGVGIMELFGNRLIGGKVMGQKALDEAELLYSQMSESERREYATAIEKIDELCADLHARGGTHSACGD